MKKRFEMRARRAGSLIAGMGFAALSISSVHAATISTTEFLLYAPDSLVFVIDSIAGSSGSNRISRYRLSNGTMSKMAEDVPPNTNLVALGNMIWFTTREAPYRIGRADLSTLYGNPVYFSAPGITSAFDDMTLGADNSLWATNSGSGKVVRVTQSGVVTAFGGNGAIHPAGIARAQDGSLWFADPVKRNIARIDPVSGAFTEYAVPQLSAATIPERVSATPASNRIWFATHDGFGSVDPVSGNVEVVATEPQQPRRMAAAADGTLWVTDGTPYVTQFTPPANFARLRVFAEATSQSAGIYIDASGIVYVSDQWNQQLARIAPAQDTPSDTVVTEFHHPELDHYFMTASQAEAAAVDGGAAGPGWARTGEAWRAWVGGPIPTAAEVCRFYGSTDVDPASGRRRGPNSHFYTLDPSECTAVKLDAGWTYERGGKFWMMKPSAVGCPAWTRPVYRAYNNRFAANDSNHRYLTSPALYAQMLAKGWSGEGVVMCAPER